MSTEIIRVPDIGGATDVEIIEISIKVGDIIEVDQSIIVLETDKASMDVPSSMAGKVKSISVKEGDKVSEGDELLVIEVEGAEKSAPETPVEASAPAKSAEKTAPASSSSSEEKVSVPDIGGATDVEVIEVCVAEGDMVEEGDSLIVLETDKASMDIPSPFTGKIGKISIKVGDTVSEGADILMLITESSTPAASEEKAEAPKSSAPAAAAPVSGGVETVKVPDIGGAEGVEVIEVAVAAGDKVKEGDSIIVLETDKASMEIPAPKSGTVKSVSIKVGDKVSEGHLVLELEVEGGSEVAASAPVAEKAAPASAEAPKSSSAKAAPAADQSAVLSEPFKKVHAGPAVRMLARELGVDLSLVRPTGPRGRITKEDLHAYVKAAVQKAASAPAGVATGSGLPTVPDQDFSKFGDIEVVKMSKIQRLTAQNMVRNALVVPQVTQFDKADISDLEDYRKGLKGEMEKQGVKLTPLPFLIKAVTSYS